MPNSDTPPPQGMATTPQNTLSPKRMVSLPFFRRESKRISTDQDPFVPKKSRGIHAGFSKRLPHDDQDVWVERIVFRGGQKAPRTYFKSVFSQVCLKEPPTGATKILYLEDLIEKEPVSNKDDKTGSCVKEKTTTKSRLTLKKREWKSLLGFGLTTYGK